MLYQKELQVKYSADVCVVGGGPSGIAAAVAAARQGADVFLIESQGCFGGAGTSAMVPTFVSFTDGVNFLSGGIGKEIFERCYRENPDGMSGKNLGYNIEGLKKQYDDLISDAGVRFLFFTDMIDAITENGRVRAIVVASKSGVYLIEASMFIDCTGDGDLCQRAGAPWVMGDENENVMGSTLCSMWVNVDWSKPNPQQDSFLDQAFADGVFTFEDRHLPGIFPTGKDTGGGNIGHVFGVHGTNEEELTRGMIEGRRILPEFVRYYHDYVKGPFENAKPATTGAVLGIRESRRILGDYVLNMDDYVRHADFHDEIGRFYYGIDVHISEPTREAFEKFSRDFFVNNYHDGENYGIPYRCLVPKNLENVYVAGRCISTDRKVQSSIRVMPCCFITGQAAGAAAALAAKEKKSSREISVFELQKRLVDMGAYLPNFRR